MIYGIRILEIAPGEYLTTCRDLPECTYTSHSAEEALADAAKAVPGSIELFYRQRKKAIPLPTPMEENETPLFIPLRVQAKILLWNTIVAKGMSLTEFAKVIGSSPSQAQRLVDFSKSASPESIEQALAQLGYLFDVSITKEQK